MLTQTRTMVKPAQHLLPKSLDVPSAFPQVNLIAFATVPLLYLSFFPANMGFLAWFALAPLLLVARAQISLRSAMLTAWGIGFATNVFSLQWVRVAHPAMYASWVGLAFYCSLYFPITIWLLRRIDRVVKAPLALTFPIVWVSLEYMKSHFLTGFPWYLLGHTQHNFLTLIQAVDLAGVYDVSLIVAAVNGLVADYAGRFVGPRRMTTSPFSIGLSACVVVVTFLGMLAYGYWRLSDSQMKPGPIVAVLQSNIDQATRILKQDERPNGLDASEKILAQMEDLTLESRLLKPDLTIWPETTFTRDWLEVSDEADDSKLPTGLRDASRYRREMVANVAEFTRGHVLLGVNAEDFDALGKSKRFNSALLVDPQGRPLGRFDKIHCVPFGEYVPMKDVFPWMQMFTPYDHEYSLTPGEKLTRFELETPRGKFSFGAIICYEDSDPLLARAYVAPDYPGGPVDFLVNLTNDGWFDGTEEHQQHLATCRFRAIESRRSVVRSVNMGISAVIDGNGRVIALPGPTWRTSKQIQKALVVEVPIDTRTSLYARLGDWLPRGLSIAAMLGLALSFWRRPTQA